MKKGRNPRGRTQPNTLKLMLICTLILSLGAVSAVVFVLVAADSNPPLRAETSYPPSEPESTLFEISEPEPYPHSEDTQAEVADLVIEFETEPDLPSPFSHLSFYLPENSHIYASFMEERPDLDPETVVWKVNASLHLPFFYQYTISTEASPLLVNSFNRLPTGFSPEGMLPVNHNNCDLLATPETVAAFRALRSASQRAGHDISAISAYRSAQRQNEIFVRQGSVDGAVMRPYHSEHQTGRALDFWGPGPGGLMGIDGPTPVSIWTAENAHLFGFIFRYPYDTKHITGIIYEPWHFTYVGLEISMYMHENGIQTLEEFVGRNPGATLEWTR